jgi:lipoate-protein ligase B
VSDRVLEVVEAGRLPYGEALAWQRQLADDRIARRLPHDLLLLLEHPPVITLGRTALGAHVLRPDGVEVVEVERGGDVTYHGPGQLVGYPIVDLDGLTPDLHWYLRTLEEALITGLAELGVAAERRPGYTGVWTRGRKIASIGVHVKRWVTWHGFALNVTTDLAAFDRIVPCGIAGVRMTSVECEREPEQGAGSGEQLWRQAAAAVVRGFEAAFGFRAVARELAAPATHSP